jgi:hypothetical protein
VSIFERTQVIADISPHVRSSVGVNFSNDIAFIVASPFMIGVTQCDMFSLDVVVVMRPKFSLEGTEKYAKRRIFV